MLRSAGERHSQLLSKVGMCDVVALEQEIEKEHETDTAAATMQESSSQRWIRTSPSPGMDASYPNGPAGPSREQSSGGAWPKKM